MSSDDKFLSLVRDMYHEMNEKNLILVYKGEITQELTRAFLSLTEEKMEDLAEENMVKRKVFQIMVECLQNIVKYAGQDNDSVPLRSAIFMVGKVEEEYTITTGNLLLKDKVEYLQSLIIKINSLDAQGLKALYRETISSSAGSKDALKGGAGLGLIDIARKSSNKLDFIIEPVNGDYSFFSLQSKVTTG